MNIIALVGRLTADPKLKHIQSGIAVSKFTIVVDRVYIKHGKEKQADSNILLFVYSTVLYGNPFEPIIAVIRNFLKKTKVIKIFRPLFS